MHWRGLSIAHARVLCIGNERESTRSWNAGIRAPSIAGSNLEWRASDTKFVMHSRTPRFEASLFENEEGSVAWRCEIPNGEVVVTDGSGEPLSGDGYAEVLEMSLPPWKLPIRELRWGRFATPDASVVWIDWRGPRPLTLVLHDGVRDSTAIVGDDTISWNGGRLILDQRRSVRDAKIGGALSALPLLRSALPKRFRQAREQKWCSRGRLMDDRGTIARGWSIHELVSFP